MNCLVTGANGFIGKHVVLALKQRGFSVVTWAHDESLALLEQHAAYCDVVFHVAGVNRAAAADDFYDGNVALAKQLVGFLEKHGNAATIIATSSVQAGNGTLYGQSKLAMEQVLTRYAEEQGAHVVNCRLPNVFGKWSKPHYNSVVATFCYQVARGESLDVHADARVRLCYIDDVVEALVAAIDTAFTLTPTYELTVAELARIIESFRTRDVVPNVQDGLIKKLYSTYVSFMPVEQLVYPLVVHEDARGAFAEFVRTAGGQVSVNISKPAMTKGEHWHQTKMEKFVVLSGEGLIRLRRIDEEQVTEFFVSGDVWQVVDIPAGYVHALVNVGTTDLVTLIWANECFEVARPDTYALEVGV